LLLFRVERYEFLKLVPGFIFIAFTYSLLASTKSQAVTYSVGTTGGLMQQPTSHYYHAVYGGFFEVGSDTEKFLGRAAYIERPEFRSVGFIDKDYGYFAMAGTKVTKTKNHGLFAFMGFGKMAGYIKADPTSAEASDLQSRNYSMPGPTALLEYMWRFHGLTIAANHQTFVGYQDQTQLKAYVAWPYNLFQVNLSYCL
jgi:hypothetical protein